MDEPLLWIGTLACASAAAAGLVPALRRRTRLAALALAVLLAPLLVLADSWNSERIADLRDRPALLLAAIVAAALGDRRRSAGSSGAGRCWLAPALIAAMPFRVPIDLGGDDANLLLPLYAVIAAGLAAAVYGAWRDRDPGPAGDERERGPWLDAVGWALAGVVVLYALQAAYVDDLTTALQNVAFFLAPFAALYLLLGDARWDRRGLRLIVAVLAIEGLVFLLAGVAEYVSGELLWNDKVISGNEAHTLLPGQLAVLGPEHPRPLPGGDDDRAGGDRRLRPPPAPRSGRRRPASRCFLFLLVISFSQTSTLAAVRRPARPRRGPLGAGDGSPPPPRPSLVALAAAVVLIAGGGLSSETTSGRAGLIDGGLEIAADHPVAGVGSGGFADEFTARYYEGEGFAAESHTEPVTIAAEQGAIGLLAYAGLLVVSFAALLSATGLDADRAAPAARRWRRRCWRSTR